MFELTMDHCLWLVAIAGYAWVCYKIFAEQKAAHKDREEQGFDLFG